MSERKSDFDPKRSSCRAETVLDFLQKDLQETDLTDVPGVGPAMRDCLLKDGITTPMQLFGKFLSFHSFTRNTCDDFYNYVRNVNSRANAHTIVFSMASYADSKGILAYEID